ncbi:sucrose synthase [Desulfonema ishimotonii]|uniref:Sucrose synthase n=1 Tax=Desulfonema ishimotonii TaxID=45657 RepID=A0A401FV16_9BACT|nr:sucrose synthase [Desulfonema ishimotonii]GBC60793.1 sucrose synthase [Desulfonema ishimotonii]
MSNILSDLIDEKEHKDFKDFIFVLGQMERKYLLRNDILLKFQEFFREKKKSHNFLTQSSMVHFLKQVPEMFISSDYLLILHRYAIGKYHFYRSGLAGDYIEKISTADYLKYKDRYVLGAATWRSKPPLKVDFMPFYDFSPSMRDSKNIGNGIRFLNKHLSSSLFQNPDKWGRKLFEFIKLHKINSNPLLINGDILRTPDEFLEELEKTLKWIREAAPEIPYTELEERLKKSGFEGGWGKDAARIRETMELVYDLFSEPDSDLLEKFISRLPMISKIAIISPHGWFGQENVLGKPDTGGQVIYILDQVRALEKFLTRNFQMAGVDIKPKIIVLTRQIPLAENTTCDQRSEKIFGTDDCWILRVPFKDKNMEIVKHWISRFHVWPYLDRFAYDSQRELLSEFQGKPDLIIGNYSDGNLVATLLSDQLDVIQCTIAHALEKTKYLLSDLYWEEMEKDYNFSIQFTADMITMNKSDFVIASTYQEIAGTETSIGQYESHQFFTLPGLYQAVSGVNLFTPKFNIVPPGVDENNYFPYYEREKRVTGKTEYWENRLFTDKSNDIYGWLKDPGKIPIFTMARFDKIKNITGLIEAFGQYPELREKCNLIFAAGTIRVEESGDREEQEQIRTAYRLFDKLDLHGHARWLPSINKADTGEVYRIFADRGGIFVQPALFEAFGLTILEAMLSGLPTFGPQFGGPSEIIEDRVSGFLMNTSKPGLIASVIRDFVQDCEKDKGHWKTIAEAGIDRVREKFTWNLYSRKLISLTKLYGFWRYSAAEEGMVKMDRYCDLLYHLLIKNRADAL